MPNNRCFLTVILEKTLESPLDCQEIKPINPKGNQPWVFIGRTDAKTEPLMIWPPDAKSRLIWKRPWCWERLKAGGEGGGRGWDGWMSSLIHGWVWANWDIVKDRESWCAAVLGIAKSDMTEQLNNSNDQEIVADRGAWCSAVHRFTKNWTCFSDWIAITKKQTKNVVIVLGG